MVMPKGECLSLVGFATTTNSLATGDDLHVEDVPMEDGVVLIEKARVDDGLFGA